MLRGIWNLPGPGIEPLSTALAGGFLTTVPPGKPCLFVINLFIYLFIFGCVGSLLLHAGFSLVAVSGGYSVAVRRLLEMASLVAEHGL